MVTELELSIYLDMRIPEFSPELFYRSSNLSYDHTRQKGGKIQKENKVHKIHHCIGGNHILQIHVNVQNNYPGNY